MLLAPVTVLLTAARAIARRPSLLAAATVLLVCLPVGPEVEGGGLADLTSAALVAVAGGRALLTGEQTLSRVAVVLFGAVLVALALATITSLDSTTSLPGLVRYTQLFVLVPVAVAISVRDRRDVALVCGALLAASVFEGALGIVQYLTGTGASYMGENVRAIGTFGATDIMAMATVVSYGILLALGLGLSARGPYRLMLLLTATILLLPLTFSLSRGAWIATAVAAAVMLLLHNVRVAAVTGLVTVALGVILVGGFGVGSEMVEQRIASIGASTTDPDQSVSDRYDLWTSAAQIWADHPVTGVGLRGFPEYRDSYAPLRLSSGSDTDDPTSGFTRQELLSPHSMFFLLLSEQGLVGLAAFGGLFGALAVAAVARTRRAPETMLRGLGLAATGALVWQLVRFGYGDVGGQTSVLMAVVLGLAARWALPARDAAAPTAASHHWHEESHHA
jgi:O-antigen ligase